MKEWVQPKTLQPRNTNTKHPYSRRAACTVLFQRLTSNSRGKALLRLVKIRTSSVRQAINNYPCHQKQRNQSWRLSLSKILTRGTKKGSLTRHHKTGKENRRSTRFRWARTFSHRTCQWAPTSARATKWFTRRKKPMRIAGSSFYRGQRKQTCQTYKMTRSPAQIFNKRLCIAVQPRKAYWWNSATTSPQSRTSSGDLLQRNCLLSVLAKSQGVVVWHRMAKQRVLSFNLNLRQEAGKRKKNWPIAIQM